MATQSAEADQDTQKQIRSFLRLAQFDYLELFSQFISHYREQHSEFGDLSDQDVSAGR